MLKSFRCPSCDPPSPPSHLRVYNVVVSFLNKGEIANRELFDFSHDMVDRGWAHSSNSGEYFYNERWANEAKLLITNMRWHSKSTGEPIWPSGTRTIRLSSDS